MASPPATTPTSTFSRERNLKYWLRCVRTLLPTEYQSQDLNRTSIAFFCIGGLDLLGELGNAIKPEERASWIDWIYSCQHPLAGFRGSPATDLGGRGLEELYDVGNVPATYFALATLLTLGDDLSRVKRKETLSWLAGLQREDGSFREYDGGAKRDLRFVYCAAATRKVLRGNEKSGRKLDEEGVRDIDIDAAVMYVRSAQAFDYGFAASPGLESHAGYAYCGIAALSLLDRLHAPAGVDTNSDKYGLPNPEGTLYWLVSRQRDFNDLNEDEDEDMKEEEEEGSTFAGFNGRCNKPADTCYSFWVAAALDLLKKSHLIDVSSNRDFLLQKTAHMIGGFGKLPGAPPDVLHSFLGPAGLSIYREEGLNRIDSELCMGLQSRERLENLPWWKGEE